MMESPIEFSAKELAHYLPPLAGYFGTFLSFLISSGLREFFKKHTWILFALLTLSLYLGYLCSVISTWLWSSGAVIAFLSAAIVCLGVFAYKITLADGNRLREKKFVLRMFAVYVSAVFLLGISGSLFTMLSLLTRIEMVNIPPDTEPRFRFEGGADLEPARYTKRVENGVVILLPTERFERLKAFAFKTGDTWSHLHSVDELELDTRLEIFGKSRRFSL